MSSEDKGWSVAIHGVLQRLSVEAFEFWFVWVCPLYGCVSDVVRCLSCFFLYGLISVSLGKWGETESCVKRNTGTTWKRNWPNEKYVMSQWHFFTAFSLISHIVTYYCREQTFYLNTFDLEYYQIWLDCSRVAHQYCPLFPGSLSQKREQARCRKECAETLSKLQRKNQELQRHLEKACRQLQHSVREHKTAMQHLKGMYFFFFKAFKMFL